MERKSKISNNLRILFKICCTIPLNEKEEDMLGDSVGYLIAEKRLHHLSPLLYTNRKVLENLDVLRLRKLNRIRVSVLANTLLKESTIGKVSSFLNENSKKTNFILLKGMAVNGDIYEKEVIRGCSDIDILIEKRNLKILQDALIKLEFKKNTPRDKPFSETYESTWFKDNIFIDLHTALLNPYKLKIKTSELFKRSELHPKYCRENVRILCDKDLFLNLSLHYQKDCYIYHHSIIDYHFLSKRFDISSIYNDPEYREFKNFFYIINECLKYIKNENYSSLYLTVIKIFIPSIRNESSKSFKAHQLVMDLLAFKSKFDMLKYYLKYFVRLLKIRK